MKHISLSKTILIITTILIIIAIIIILTYNVRIYRINGTSMYPTLNKSEIVLTSKDTYKRTDIIAFSYNDVIMIKRIIGMPNETIDIKEDGTIYINNQELEEKYINEKNLGDPEIEFPYHIPEGEYFVLGDNRADSIDSRNIHIGTIKEQEIIGKVKISLIPFKEIK